MMAHAESLCPKEETFISLQVYKRVGISEVYVFKGPEIKYFEQLRHGCTISSLMFSLMIAHQLHCNDLEKKSVFLVAM